MLKSIFAAFLISACATSAIAQTPGDDAIRAHFDAFPWIAGWERQGSHGGYELIAVRGGGNACPATFYWAVYVDGTLEVSEEFGTCAYPEDVTVENGRVIVVMPSFDPSKGDIRFTYDGDEIVEEVLGLKSSGVSDAAAWAEKSVYDYMTAGENEALLLSLMEWGDLEAARRASVVGEATMSRDGNWVTGSACRPHMCGDTMMALAINVASGETIVALKEDGVDARLFGKPSEAMPAEVRSVLTAH